MDDRLAARLGELKERFDETIEEMADPEVLADQDRYREVSIRHAELRPIIEAFVEYQDARAEMAEAIEMAAGENDAEMHVIPRGCRQGARGEAGAVGDRVSGSCSYRRTRTTTRM